MNGRRFDWREFDELLRSFASPGVVGELGVLALCLGAAYLVVWAVRPKARPPGSVWFGEHLVDGVLFPAVALVFAYAARYGVTAWTQPAVFRVAIPILVSLAAIRLAVRVLRRAFPNVGWVRNVEVWISWLAWVAVVLWLTGLGTVVLDAMDGVSWKLGSSRTSLRTIVEGLVVASVVIVVTLWISAALEKRLLANAAGHDVSLRKIAATLLRSGLLFLGLMVALTAVGIDLTALSVLGGAIGVGIGFGLQKIAANYVSGFVILAERSIRIGDIVKVDTFEGRITDIRTRYTIIRATNGREAIVPNETLITQRIESSTFADTRVLVKTKVQVAYGTDVRALKGRLEEAIAGVERVLAEPGPGVSIEGFGADGIDLEIAFWIVDPQNGQGNVKSEVHFVILATLERLGVEIPYPQREVRATIERRKPA
jgi:small-conductance mechanosensitive channel